MTPDQQKYLTYLIMLKEFRQDYKRYVMGFEHKGEMDWKTYEQWRDEVIESFPEEGIQIGKYKAMPLNKPVVEKGVIKLIRQSIVLFKFNKGEKP